MSDIRCIFVEKKPGFDVEAKSLLDDFKRNLRLENLEKVRVINKYTIGEVSDEYYKKFPLKNSIESYYLVENSYSYIKIAQFIYFICLIINYCFCLYIDSRDRNMFFM